MWLFLSFLSAFFLGFYDVSKKKSLQCNSVFTVLFLSTLFSTIIFLPVISSSLFGLEFFGDSILDIPRGNLHDHLLVVCKSALVLSSWVFGYFAIKHLPLSIYGPISATRPVLVLIGAMIFFGERLNLAQWGGVLITIISVYLLSRSGRKEGIYFGHNKWILCAAIATILGAVCGLYDKFIIQRINSVFVQGWYNFYQMIMMGCVVLAMKYFKRRRTAEAKEEDEFHWSWAIPLISIFISAADFAYLYALTDADAMISIVSIIRRGSVIISFTCGALIFKEKNLRSKAVDLVLVLLGMAFLFFGSR